MAAESSVVDVAAVGVVDGDESRSIEPEKLSVAAAAGEEESTSNVDKVVERGSEFKLNPSAAEFVPASRLPPSELNGGVDITSHAMGWSLRGLSASAPEFVSERRRSGGQRRRRRNTRNRSWRQRISQYRQTQEERIRRTVYVTDIDGNVTEDYLAAVFSSCGQVVDCRICGDPNCVLRFGFIEFASEHDAKVALGLGGTVLGFFRILVLPSKTAILPINPDFLPQSEDDLERCSRTIYCTNIDRRVNHIEVRGFFENFCGQVSRLRLLRHYAHSTSIAFVEFTETESAVIALNYSGMFLGAFCIRVNPSKTPVRS